MCLVWLFAWYGDTAASIAAIWMRSDTYAHGFLIIPISAYLIWQRRSLLRTLSPAPAPIGLLAVAGCGFAWMLGSLASVTVVEQYAFVATVAALAWTTLGTQVVLAVLFPIGFLFFAVPVGEFLIPPLIEFTADFTVAALRVTGIPVYREGSFFSIPSGNWSVVEACSGLRYLIASLTLGCLFAYLTYKSYVRRMLFVVISVVLPIVANGIRAYIIVLIGHLSDMRLAVGVDHLIYGWIFFGLVMLLLFWIGSFWREEGFRQSGEEDFVEESAVQCRASPTRLIALAAGSAALLSLWPILAAHRSENTVVLEATTQDFGLPTKVGAWTRFSDDITDWRPRYAGAWQESLQVFAKNQARVGVIVKHYRVQRPGAELISSNNKIVSSDNRIWAKSSEATKSIAVSGRKIGYRETRLRAYHQNLLIWDWYWIDGVSVTNDYLAKLLQARSRLLGRGDYGAAIFLYAESTDQLDDTRRNLEEFIGSAMPILVARFETAKAQR